MNDSLDKPEYFVTTSQSVYQSAAPNRHAVLTPCTAASPPYVLENLYISLHISCMSFKTSLIELISRSHIP